MFDSLTHHAYAVAGEGGEVIPQLLSALKKAAHFEPRGNPDFRSESFDMFGIDEARALKEAAERKGVSGGKKVFIISARGITKEAQNALLKIFEEPPEGTHFFLVVPAFETLLPTLRSRLFVLQAKERSREESSRAALFLHATIPARLKTVQAFLKGAEEDDGKRDLISFLDELERTTADTRKLKTQMYADEERAYALSEILKVKKYCRDRAPSFKLLLEHLALVLPQL